jgi:FkbM family methyltransferase
VKLPNGGKLKLYSWGNRVENELSWRGWDGHEPEERQCWAEMVKEGGDILDIGANTATFGILAKAASPQSRVVAFEPIKRIAARARQNVATSGLEIEIICAALARKKGELPIYDPGGENVYSASLDADFLPGEKATYIVPVDSLDQYCAENKVDPTAIKLDVEGYEGEVICGGAELLKRGRCTFLCEWLGKSGAHLEALELLHENGYIALDTNDLSEADLSAAKEYGDRNVILVHRRKAQALIDQIRISRG